MNSLANCIKNYLFITNLTDDYLQKLYKLCLSKVANGDLVLILTFKLYDFSQTMEQLNISKEQINNLIIMHYKSVEEISSKLLQLHCWSLKPTLVVVDLFHLIQLESTPTTVLSTSLMQSVTLCTVALLAYLQSIALQQDGKESKNKKPIQGLLILTSLQDDKFSTKQIQIIKDLYFYNAVVVYHNFDDISSKILENHTVVP